MLIYSKTKQDFMEDMDNDVLVETLIETLREKMHRNTPRSEVASWENSLGYMYKVLNTDIPGDCGVAIEYNVPLTAKRVDFIISGYDEGGTEHADIIELKQWSEATKVSGQDAIVRTFTGGALRDVAHPSYQAWSYAQLISDYNSSVQDRSIVLHPCAFAHNYLIDGSCALADPAYQEYLDRAPLFGKHDVSKLRSFIKKELKRGDRGAVLEHIEHGKLRPSKSLQDSLKGMLKGNEEFVLIDTQKVFYEKALMLAREARQNNKKVVYIVEGGPGTGKSVIAINLLAQLTLEGQVAAYVSKNSAPRNVYSTELKGTRSKKSIDALFKGSGTFYEVDTNVYDTLIVDEAHRLNEKSGLFGNLGENQIKEIINAARCSIFFIDESQRVTLKDIGSVEEIEKQASLQHASVYRDELDSQFRCNGSDGYLAWIDNTLGIRETANWNLEGIDYDIEVLDSPQELERAIRIRNRERNKARLVAGYCWGWDTKTRSNSSVHDIEIGDWSISWNLDSTQTFAIDEGSVNECGCIHTVQGLEFDYVGVIIGPDMRFENGRVVTDASAHPKTDNALKGIKTMAKKDPERAYRVADQLIKNTYRTLMTRGMKGCYVYCVDEPLREYLRSRVEDYLVEYDETGVTRIESVEKP